MWECRPEVANLLKSMNVTVSNEIKQSVAQQYVQQNKI